MSIAKRVEEAIGRMEAGDPEAALIPASIAVAATAAREHRKKKDNVAYKRFLSDNLAIITKVAFGGVSITKALNLQYDHPELKPNAEGLVSFEQIMYHVVRCGLVHGAGLPTGLQFIVGSPIKVDSNTNTLILPAQLILGMLAAVVISPVNAAESSAKMYQLNYRGQPIRLHRFWGQKTQFVTEIERLDAV